MFRGPRRHRVCRVLGTVHDATASGSKREGVEGMWSVGQFLPFAPNDTLLTPR